MRVAYNRAMRTTLNIDDTILSDARDVALAQGRPLGDVVSDLLRTALRPIGIRDEDGLPVFDLPADASILTTREVAELLDEP